VPTSIPDPFQDRLDSLEKTVANLARDLRALRTVVERLHRQRDGATADPIPPSLRVERRWLGERALGVIDDVGDANPVTLRTPQGSVVIRVPAQRSGKGRHRKESRLAAPGRRVGWGLADQAVSSITNFAVGIVVARSLGPVEFGIFGLAWVTYAVLLNISRGLATDPLAVRFSGAPTASWRRPWTRAK